MPRLPYMLLILAACRAPRGAVIVSPLVDEVRVMLDSTRAEPPRLVLSEEPSMPCGARAACYDDHITVMADGQSALDFYIAHELAHWYIVESPYAGLPYFMEEGLADWVSCSLLGLLDLRIQESARIGILHIQPEYLSLDFDGWKQLSSSERDDLARAGFDLIERLGLPTLRALLRESREPIEIVRAAGVLEQV